MIQKPPPSLARISPELERYLNSLTQSLESINNQVSQIQSQHYLTRSAADSLYSTPIQRSALQANGTYPLNVTQLLGVLAQPQSSGAPTVTALPGFTDPRSQDGALVSYNGQLYRYTASPAPGAWLPLSASAVILSDTRANRIAHYPAASYPLHTLFYETDTTLIYIVALVLGVHTWVYFSGTYSITQPYIAGFIMGLNTPDTGLLMWVSDYNHILQWNGAQLIWAPGELGSDYFVFGPAMTAVGWVPANGVNVSYLKKDGTTGNRTLPDLVGNAAFLQSAAAYSAAVNAATSPNDSDAGVLVTVAGSGTLVALNPHKHPGTLPANVNIPVYYRI